MHSRERGLSLPDEFVLLMHKPNGSYYATTDRVVAAEIGDLALRGHVRLDGKQLHVLDARPTGTPWADDLLARLDERSRSRERPVDAGWFLQNQSSALPVHREVLRERGLLIRRPKKFLWFIPDDRYYPDRQERDGLVGEIRRAATGEQTVDDQLALLCALVHASGLAFTLGFDRAERAGLRSISSGDQLGSAVDASTGAAVAAVTAMSVATTIGGAST